jgi:hypothetical protein
MAETTSFFTVLIAHIAVVSIAKSSDFLYFADR